MGRTRPLAAAETGMAGVPPGHPPDSVEDALSHALDVGLAGSLNVRRTALRVLDLVRGRIGDWAVLVLDEPPSRRRRVFGGVDPGYSASMVLPAGAEPGQPFIGGAEAPADLIRIAGLLLDDRLLGEAAAITSTIIQLPLVARGDRIGTLLVGRSDGRPWEQQTRSLAARVARRAGLVLESALIYERHITATRVLEHSLRPPHLPASEALDLAAWFRPANERMELGGDFYDVLGSEADRLLVLGDVCGKGVEAAVLNLRARQTIRTAAHLDPRPGRVLDILNVVLCQEPTERFVTVACARLRPAAKQGQVQVDVAVAGHAPPLVVRGNGDVEEPVVRGRLAGVLPHGDPHQEARLHLGAQDMLVLYTDGVPDARGPGGHYGTDRLRALLSRYHGTGAQTVCEAIGADVVEHLAGRGHDDITVLVASVRGRP